MKPQELSLDCHAKNKHIDSVWNTVTKFHEFIPINLMTMFSGSQFSQNE